MAITTKTIFTNSLNDIDLKIAFILDNESLVNLSGVNKQANKILSNIFFKMLFNTQHPCLKDFEFKNLCGFCPDSCWKIACFAFSKGKLQLSNTYILECSPNIYKFIQSQKTEIETKQRGICGSFYKDPNSPIHRAWEAKDEKYEKLEKERVECVAELEQISKELTVFNSSGEITVTHDMDEKIYRYRAILNAEFLQAKKGEIASVRLPLVEKCVGLINKLVNHPEEASLDAFASIRQMINSFDPVDMEGIWGGLYNWCANEVQEDKWSETHFPEFLQPLLTIVGSVADDYEYDKNKLSGRPIFDLTHPF